MKKFLVRKSIVIDRRQNNTEFEENVNRDENHDEKHRYELGTIFRNQEFQFSTDHCCDSII